MHFATLYTIIALHLVTQTATMRISTLNCRGLRHDHKINALHQHIQKHNIDILLLQETHIDSLQIGNEIAQKLDGKIIWSLTTPRGKGAALYINNKLNAEIHHFQTDFLGRYITATVTINACTMQITNIYAPNDLRERKNFFKDLYPLLATSHPQILAGDFNCIANSALDKIGGNPETGKVGHAELSAATPAPQHDERYMA
ncbi:hypothetical protein C0Q70_07644 [Pomacea canaliculata]|uniref:exodeoxyribonuclease III n=1 Tax=Pomacea canaliculata TaxID=400727 RepID=A0A2T7PFL6_POMCA|nr:hypothetical protein C0Q70_07644 [Pomacea canaliculata]